MLRVGVYEHGHQALPVPTVDTATTSNVGIVFPLLFAVTEEITTRSEAEMRPPEISAVSDLCTRERNALLSHIQSLLRNGLAGWTAQVLPGDDFETHAQLTSSLRRLISADNQRAFLFGMIG